MAVDNPTRRPVYDPGPLLTATALQSLTLRPLSFSISLMKGAVIEAWALGSVLSFSLTTTPSSTRAAEHREVEVSIRIILSIIC